MKTTFLLFIEKHAGLEDSIYLKKSPGLGVLQENQMENGMGQKGRWVRVMQRLDNMDKILQIGSSWRSATPDFLI